MLALLEHLALGSLHVQQNYRRLQCPATTGQHFSSLVCGDYLPGEAELPLTTASQSFFFA